MTCSPCPHLTLLSLLLPLLATLFVLCAPALAQAETDPGSRDLVAKLDAARGAAKLPATLVVEGTFAVRFEGAANDQPVAEGPFRDVFAGTDRARHRSSMGEFGALERGLTPDLVWEVDPALGAKRYDGAAGRTVRRWFAILRGQSPTTLYRRIEHAGTREVDGCECAVLRMTPAEGAAETWYVDPATGQLRGVDMALPSPDSAGAVFDMAETIDARLRLSDWREVEGISWPHRRRLEMGPATVVSTCTSIAPGAALEGEAFAVPEAVRKLPERVAGRPVDAAEGPTYLVVDRPAQPVVSIRTKCRPDEISKTLAVLLPEVMAHITATGGRISGPPFSRYHGFSATAVDLEAGIPVAAPVAEKGRVKNGELPAGRTLTAWHIGPYDRLGAAHEALQAHAAAEELQPAGAPWEVYWTDPGMVPDSAKWRTQLFLPIAK